MKTSCVIILAGGKNCQSRYPPKDSLSLIPRCVQPERFRLHWQYTALWNFRWTSHRSWSSTYCSSKAPKVTCTTVLTQRYTTVQWYAVQSKNTSCVWSLIPSLNCELTIELKIHIKVRNVCYLWRMMSVLPLSGSWCYRVLLHQLDKTWQQQKHFRFWGQLQLSEFWDGGVPSAQTTPLDRGQVLTLYSGMQYVKSLHHHEQIILQCLYTNTHINSTVFVLLLYWTLPSF